MTREPSEKTDARAIPKLALRPREAAAALGISPRTLWSITADQTSGIPHARLGRVVVYPVAELCAWLAARAAANGKGVPTNDT